MLPDPYIKPELQKYIQQKLAKIAQENNVSILLSVESGSRAWGFPSVDSDYDVRFIYVRPSNTYLSIKEYREVIETPIIHDNSLGVPFDLNGWDLRKALMLGVKSNHVLIEWLRSPIRYSAYETMPEDLLNFALEAANINYLKYHYDRLARNAWEQIQENKNDVKVKLYCYVLRPVMALQWISQYNKAPPMDMKSLCQTIAKDVILQKEIADLIDLKSQAKEADLIYRNHRLDSFIEFTLQNKPERPIELLKNENDFINKADLLFQKIINGFYKPSMQ
jgi:predicted nucleotidyltransferase